MKRQEEGKGEGKDKMAKWWIAKKEGFECLKRLGKKRERQSFKKNAM